MYVYTAPSGVEVRTETYPVHLDDNWFRWGHVSFALESYYMWSKKIVNALRPKPVADDPDDEQAQGKVGTL